MKTPLPGLFTLWMIVMLSVFSSGCAAFRASTTEIDVDEKKHFDEKFDYSDMRSITESVADELLASPFLTREDDPPLMMIAGIQNRTSVHVDTKQLTDRMRTMLIRSGRMEFVNAARRDELIAEQGYQAAHATSETQTMVGQQLGAKYMLTGSLVEMKKTSPRQVRISKQKLNYYNLAMEITDLESGVIKWTTEKEFARQASQPLIGW